jgi:hypothetical protein
LGGLGSGRGVPGKQTVERSLSIDVSTFAQNELRWGKIRSGGFLVWNNWFLRREVFRCQFEVIMPNASFAFLVLTYRGGATQGIVSCDIELASTRPNFGGCRWWFCCPSVDKAGPCGRRVTKLYYHGGTDRFACRVCHRLTYRSCQQTR